MFDLGGILAAGILATALPTLVGIIIAYSIITTILGTLLWAAKSVPDDVAIAIVGSGIVTGVLFVIAVFIIRFLFR